LLFTATGTYSDKTTKDLTTQVTWASSKTAVATISNTAGSKGLATAVAMGTSTISAKLGSIMGSTVLTVTSASPQSTFIGSLDGGSNSTPSGANSETTSPVSNMDASTSVGAGSSPQTSTSQSLTDHATGEVATHHRLKHHHGSLIAHLARERASGKGLFTRHHHRRR
jgi:hypothetical protein